MRAALLRRSVTWFWVTGPGAYLTPLCCSSSGASSLSPPERAHAGDCALEGGAVGGVVVVLCHSRDSGCESCSPWQRGD